MGSTSGGTSGDSDAPQKCFVYGWVRPGGTAEERENQEVDPSDAEIKAVSERCMKGALVDGLLAWDTVLNAEETRKVNEKWSLARLTFVLKSPSLPICLKLKDALLAVVHGMQVRGRPLEVSIDSAKWRKPFRRAAAVIHSTLESFHVARTAKQLVWPKDEVGVLRCKVRMNDVTRTIATFTVAQGWSLIEENITECWGKSADEFRQRMQERERRSM